MRPAGAEGDAEVAQTGQDFSFRVLDHQTTKGSRDGTRGQHRLCVPR